MESGVKEKIAPRSAREGHDDRRDAKFGSQGRFQYCKVSPALCELYTLCCEEKHVGRFRSVLDDFGFDEPPKKTPKTT